MVYNAFYSFDKCKLWKLRLDSKPAVSDSAGTVYSV